MIDEFILKQKLTKNRTQTRVLMNEINLRSNELIEIILRKRDKLLTEALNIEDYLSKMLKCCQQTNTAKYNFDFKLLKTNHLMGRIG